MSNPGGLGYEEVTVEGDHSIRVRVRGRHMATALFVVVGLVTVVGARSAAAPASPLQTIPTLRIGASTPLSTLDSARTTEGLAFTVEGYGVESLVTIAPDGSVRPHLAKSVTQPSPVKYVYTLRKGIKFWDGNELTAADAANALNYYRYKGFHTSGAHGYPSVKSIVAKGRYQVVVTLKSADSTWQYTPAIFGWIFEKKFQAEHGADMGKPDVLVMGTGPWKFDSLDPTRRVVMSANPNYWGGKVPIQRLSVEFIPDQTSLALAYRAGQIDVAYVSDPRSFSATSGARITNVPQCGIIQLGLNTKLAPWRDVHVRRAAAYAISRNDLMAAAGITDTATPVYTLIHPVLLQSLAPKPAVDKLLKSVNQYRLNLDKARAEMRQSAFPNGVKSEIEIYNFQPYPQVMQVLAANLARVGIDVDVKVVPVAQWLATANGPHQNIPMNFTGHECTNPDPGSLLRQIVDSKNATTGRLNRSDYTNPKADALIDAGRKTSDRAKRFGIYSDLLSILSRDVPYIPLYSSKNFFALSPKFNYGKFNTYAPLDVQTMFATRPR